MFNTRLCPECESGYSFHEVGCSLDSFEMWEIERAYIDIVSRLTSREEPWQYDELREDIEELKKTSESQVAFESTGGGESLDHPGWTPIHTKCLHKLKNVGRAVELDDGIQPSEPGEYLPGVVPTNDPIRTVYEYGPIDGCKDYAVYSMVSWCELVELGWEQTVAFVVHWLQESGRWEDESWAEGSPKQLVKGKKHVHEKGLGWGEYPSMAKTEMESSSKERRLDAEEQAAILDRELLSAMDV